MVCATKAVLDSVISRIHARPSLPRGWGVRRRDGSFGRVFIRSDGIRVEIRQEVPDEVARWTVVHDEGQGVTREGLSMSVLSYSQAPVTLLEEVNRRWPV